MPVLLFLALLWAAVLVPVAVNMVANRRAYYASSFGDGLQALEQAEGFFGPDADLPPEPAVGFGGAEAIGPFGGVDAALLRSILAGLLIAVVVSLVVAVVTSQRAMLAMHIALDDCLLGFVGLLVLRRDASDRRRSAQPTHAPERAGVLVDEPAPPRRAYAAGVPVIAAPVVGAMTGGLNAS
jgi:hypothetical protein